MAEIGEQFVRDLVRTCRPRACNDDLIMVTAVDDLLSSNIIESSEREAVTDKAAVAGTGAVNNLAGEIT